MVLAQWHRDYSITTMTINIHLVNNNYTTYGTIWVPLRISDSSSKTFAVVVLTVGKLCGGRGPRLVLMFGDERFCNACLMFSIRLSVLLSS